MNNYIQVTAGSIFNNIFSNYYFYIDTTDYKADSIFMNQHIRVKIKQEWYNSDNNYCIIMVKINKKDTNKFKSCMDLLIQKQLICNNSNYVEEANCILTGLIKSYYNIL